MAFMETPTSVSEPRHNPFDSDWMCLQVNLCKALPEPLDPTKFQIAFSTLPQAPDLHFCASPKVDLCLTHDRWLSWAPLALSWCAQMHTMAHHSGLELNAPSLRGSRRQLTGVPKMGKKSRMEAALQNKFHPHPFEPETLQGGSQGLVRVLVVPFWSP